MVSATVSCSDVNVSGTLISSAVKAFDVSMLSKASLAAAIALSEVYGDISAGVLATVVSVIVVLVVVVSATDVVSVFVLATVVSVTVVFFVVSVAVLLVSAVTASVVVFKGCASSA